MQFKMSWIFYIISTILSKYIEQSTNVNNILVVLILNII